MEWAICTQCGTGGNAEVMLVQQQGSAGLGRRFFLLEICYCCMESLYRAAEQQMLQARLASLAGG